MARGVERALNRCLRGQLYRRIGAFAAVIGTILVVLTYRGAVADEPLALKPGAASDTTTAVCSACHTSDYIVMNSRFLTLQAWQAEVTKMRSVYGAPIDDQTAAAVTAYLGDNYGVAAKK